MRTIDHMKCRIRTSVLEHGNGIRSVAKRWGISEAEVRGICAPENAISKAPRDKSFNDLLEDSIDGFVQWVCDTYAIDREQLIDSDQTAQQARCCAAYNLSHRWGLSRQDIIARLGLRPDANVSDTVKRCLDQSAPAVLPPLPDLPEPYLGELTHIARVFQSTPYAVWRGQFAAQCEARGLWLSRLNIEHKIPRKAIADTVSIPLDTVHRAIQKRRAA